MSAKIEWTTAPGPRRTRFLAKIDVRGPGECWEWTAYRTVQGYGRHHWEGQPRGAHRVAWMMLRGPIPDGLHVLHHCDNPPCCNPDHMFLGTNEDNIRDMERKGRRGSGGGIRGEKNVRTRLTDAQALEIKRRSLSEGHRRCVLAAEFDVSATTIYDIVSGRRWTHLPEVPE